MSQTDTTDGERSMRLRRLRFRAWHRGMREVDLILGRFADVHLDSLSNQDIAAFEALLGMPDRLVLAWTTGATPVPAVNDTPLIRRIIASQSGELKP